MKFICTIFLVATTFISKAQSSSLRINPNIVLPKDSLEGIALTNSLNDFLTATRQANEENRFVLESEKAATFILLDEIRGLEKSARFKDDNFFKPYLTNVVVLNDSQYLVQLSYLGSANNESWLRASFDLIAQKRNNTFLFSSTLFRNTANWELAKVGNVVFHYRNTLNKAKAKAYNKLVAAYDEKLGSTKKITEIYCCDDMIELQKLIGLGYKSDYNGRASGIWSASWDNKKLIVLGNRNGAFNSFDPHDLWHERLGLVVARSKVNKPVDEGCAYLYGGSWGLSWKEILHAFKEQVASDSGTNWAALKETPVYFKTGEFKNSADNIVNALLVQQIEKEKGFAGVWELLTVGPVEKGNEKYYQVLEKLTGITKANYNKMIWELVKMNQ